MVSTHTSLTWERSNAGDLIHRPSCLPLSEDKDTGWPQESFDKESFAAATAYMQACSAWSTEIV